GYGFGSSVSQAGLFLVPTTIALLTFSPLGGRLSGIVGSKVPLVLGSVVTTMAFVVLAIADTRWEIYLASTLVGVGVGFAFASSAQRERETDGPCRASSSALTARPKPTPRSRSRWRRPGCAACRFGSCAPGSFRRSSTRGAPSSPRRTSRPRRRSTPTRYSA